jgi:transposase InsO family protein
MRRLDGRRCGRVRFHTEQGSEYSARVFRAACDRLDITQSMGRPGSALGNAVIESWHSTLEFELRRAEHFPTTTEAVGGWRHRSTTTTRTAATLRSA